MEEVAVKKKKGINDLTQGPILKKLLMFALPFMAANLLNTLYALVDLAIVGKVLGTTALAGVANGGQITMILYAIGIGLGAGGQVLISQLTGAGQRHEYQKTIGTLLSFGMLGSLGTAIIGITCARPLLSLINTPAGALDLAVDYLVTCAFGFVFCVGFNTLSAVLRGMGDSRTPFLIIGLCAVMNVVLDIILVRPMGVVGAALATVISQVCSFAFAVVYLYHRRETFGFDFKPASFRIDGEKLKIILKLSVPLMLSVICINISILFINSYVNPFGEVASAVNGVGSKLARIMQVVTQALQTAMAGFVGQNMGARKPERVKKAAVCAVGIGFVFWLVVAGVCTVFPQAVFGLFSDDPAVLKLAVDYLKINIWNYLAWAIMAPALGVMSGVGATTLQMGVSLLDGMVGRISLSLLFGIVLSMQLKGFWLGSAMATYVTVILAWIYFLSNRWQKRVLV